MSLSSSTTRMIVGGFVSSEPGKNAAWPPGTLRCVFMFSISVERLGREPAAFISWKVREPQRAGAENECAAGKGGSCKQAEEDGKEHHMHRTLHGVMAS